MSWAYHPLFRGILLPATLCLAACLVAFVTRHRRADPSRAAAAAVGIATCCSLFLVAGAAWPPASAVQQLPWLGLSAVVLGGLVQAWRWRRSVQLAACLIWAAAAVWLLGPRASGLQAFALATVSAVSMGAFVLLPTRADAGRPVSLGVVALGLAALVMLAGSALLFECALALGVACLVCAAFVDPLRALRFDVAAAVAGVLIWWLLAYAAFLLTPIHGTVLGVLALGLCMPAAVAAWQAWRGDFSSRLAGFVTTALVVGWTLGALAFAFWGQPDAVPPSTDDAYYTPRW